MRSRSSSRAWRTAIRSDPGLRDPAPEHAGEGVDDLAERRVRTYRVEQRGHEIGGRLLGVGPDPRQRSCHCARVAFVADLLDPAPLLLLDLRSDAQRLWRRLVVPFEELRDTHDHVTAVVQLALQLVRGIG